MVLLVWIARLALLCVIRRVLSHDNREVIRLEINAEETAETERHDRNNCSENISEVQVVIFSEII